MHAETSELDLIEIMSNIEHGEAHLQSQHWGNGDTWIPRFASQPSLVEISKPHARGFVSKSKVGKT